MIPHGDLYGAYHRASGLLASGELREAADLCREMLEYDPEFPYGYHLMASLFKATGTYEKALTFSQIAINKAPDVAHFHLQQGQVLLAMGDWMGAIKSFARAHRLDPVNPTSLLLWANGCMRQGRLDKALKLCARARSIANIPEIDEHEGLCLQLKGDLVGAEDCFDRLIERRPQHARGYLHKGKLMFARRMLPEAEAWLAKALRHDPQSFEALHYIGVINAQQGQPEIAIAYMLQAIKANPLNWESHSFLGYLLLEQRRYDVAQQVLEQAHRHHPEDVYTLHLLIITLLSQDKRTQAVQLAESRLNANPDNHALRYMDAMLRGAAPSAPPSSYISGLFNGCAGHYDYHMRQVISYQVPELLHAMVQSASAGRQGLSLLDMGCGTGLAAEALQGLTSVAVGVDLSDQMLEKAREKRLYDLLYPFDAVEFLLASTRKFDLVVAADTLPYLGSLAPFLRAARNVLPHDGLLVFSIELGRGESAFHLQECGRYTHRPDYIRQLAAEEGYVIISEEEAMLSMPDFHPLPGMLFLLRKAPIH